MAFTVFSLILYQTFKSYIRLIAGYKILQVSNGRKRIWCMRYIEFSNVLLLWEKIALFTLTSKASSEATVSNYVRFDSMLHYSSRQQNGQHNGT